MKTGQLSGFSLIQISIDQFRQGTVINEATGAKEFFAVREDKNGWDGEDQMVAAKDRKLIDVDVVILKRGIRKHSGDHPFGVRAYRAGLG